MGKSVESIKVDVNALRQSFNEEKTRPLESRKKILKQIYAMISENEKKLQNAVKKDLHRHPHETVVSEINSIKAEIQEHLDYMDDWSSPKSVPTSIACLPGYSYIVPEPLGVVLLFGTWNYPIYVTLLPLVGAISAGNCAFIRLPADGSTDETNAVMAELIDRYLDKDVVRYTKGGLDISKEVLAQKYDLIFCTGSERIGKIISRVAAETLTPVVLELGGKSPVIIDEAVNIEIAAKRIVWGGFLNAGQTCVRPDYILVADKIGEKFVNELIKQTKSFFSNNPEEVEHFSRVANSLQFNKMKHIIETDAAYLVHGGQMNSNDNYVAPTILNFKNDSKGFQASAAMVDEIFGPILPVQYYDNLTTVLEEIRGRPKPLSLYCFSTNSSTIDRVVKSTSSGSICINDVIMQMANHNLPFGGVGASGMGRYHGKYSFSTFSHEKSVLRKYFWLDLPQRYMPYTPFSIGLIQLLTRPIPRLYVRHSSWFVIVLFVAWLAKQYQNHKEKVLEWIK